MSIRPGRTVIPSVEITSTPGGTATSLLGPTATMRSPAMQHHAVVDRRTAVAVENLAADESEGRRRLGGGERRERDECGDGEDERGFHGGEY